MIPYTGDYIEHIDDRRSHIQYYTFTPRPLMQGNMFRMDDELASLLADAYQNIGFLEGVLMYAPNKDAWRKLMVLKECTYSRMIDYNDAVFQKVLTNFGTGKGGQTPIVNLRLAYNAARNYEFSTSGLSKLYRIALCGNTSEKSLNVRNTQTFWLNATTNIRRYNPSDPDAVLPALADISAYLINDKDTDPIIKSALAHYQFEMIHPFEQYNGIIGRIGILMIPSNISEAARFSLCLSKHLYCNINEYFDLLRTTQYSGGYIRWIKFFVNAVSMAAKCSANVLMQYENTISMDEKRLNEIPSMRKSVWTVYNHIKRFPITNITFTIEQTGLSFNSISKALNILKDNYIVTQNGDSTRNRIWEYDALKNILL